MINNSSHVTRRFERIGQFCAIAHLHNRNLSNSSNSKETPGEIFLFVPDILFLVERNPLCHYTLEFDRITGTWIRVYMCEEEAGLDGLTFLSRICTSSCYTPLFPPQQKGRGIVRNIHAPVEHQDGRYAIPLVRDYDSTLLLRLVEEVEQQCGVISPEKEFLGPNSFGQLEFRSAR